MIHQFFQEGNIGPNTKCDKRAGNIEEDQSHNSTPKYAEKMFYMSLAVCLRSKETERPSKYRVEFNEGLVCAPLNIFASSPSQRLILVLNVFISHRCHGVCVCVCGTHLLPDCWSSIYCARFHPHCRLAGFSSHHGADFYGIPRNEGSLTLVKEKWTVPACYTFGQTEVVPLRAGEEVFWQLVGEGRRPQVA